MNKSLENANKVLHELKEEYAAGVFKSYEISKLICMKTLEER